MYCKVGIYQDKGCAYSLLPSKDVLVPFPEPECPPSQSATQYYNRQHHALHPIQ